MKKIVFAFLFVFVFLPFFVFGEELQSNEFQWTPVILLSSDVILAGVSVAAIVQQNKLATDYEKLRTKIGTAEEKEYWRLKYENEKVKSAGDIALIVSSATGAVILFTVFDYFFLHSVFKVEVAPLEKGAKVGMNIKY